MTDIGTLDYYVHLCGDGHSGYVGVCLSLICIWLYFFIIIIIYRIAAHHFSDYIWVSLVYFMVVLTGLVWRVRLGVCQSVIFILHHHINLS